VNYVSLDLETRLIEPGNLTPRPIVASFAAAPDFAYLMSIPALLDGGTLGGMLEDEETTFVTANGFYDFGCLCAVDPSLYPLVFKAYADGRIRCVQVREKLKDIAAGKLGYSGYSLADLETKYLGIDRSADKTGADAWRLRYSELEGVPLDQWPEAAARYAKADAEGTLRVFLAQGPEPLPGEIEITRSNWALHLMSCRGMVTDPAAVERLKGELHRIKDSSFDRLKAVGFYRLTGSQKAVREGRGTWAKDTKVIKARVEKAFPCARCSGTGQILGYTAMQTNFATPPSGPPTAFPCPGCGGKGSAPPLTEKGAVSTDRDTLERTKDPDLQALADVGFVDKLLTTYVPVLERGARAAVLPRYDIAESCRTTCSGGRDGPDGVPLGCNIQNLPRKGNVRECFVPRPGYVFVFCDYSTLELRALAQVCLNWFGASKMADAIRAGRDLHLEFGAQLLGITYDEAARRSKEPEVREARQFAKVANFGLPGALGARTLVEYARASYGVEMSEYRARQLKSQWLRAFPEMARYFQRISDLVERTDRIKSFGAGMQRGGVTYTSACNHYFQNLAAQGAREAAFRVAREAYTGDTALRGSFPVAFIHDEIIAEVPADRAHEAATRLSEVMVEAMAQYIPDLPVLATPALAERWYKGAEAVYVNGRLVPWRPSVDVSS
jgi:DNA polymerase-1